MGSSKKENCTRSIDSESVKRKESLCKNNKNEVLICWVVIDKHQTKVNNVSMLDISEYATFIAKNAISC